MDCEICKAVDPGCIVILPIRQSEGNLITIACKSCAEISTAFCTTHDQVHQGFMDGTTACPACIEEMVRSQIDQAMTISNRLVVSLPEHQLKQLEEAVETASYFTRVPFEVCVLRFIATKAMRTGRMLHDVFVQVIKEQSADFILRN